ncbi:SAM-dependent methyltransferase [Pseudoduganella lutea]|uniref:Class I SAM-dependent methyltransferase n=1 Tax=Pseudoduganella lutea TaxID=321985 RepID=A0A4V0Z408_9BURK|nr:class I SAM-dependent methyltransferase [Pseudoduganella lutea]QBE65293.1 class I SAM-dependent methyltransferase [Pseudoduganella lutea]
MTPARLFRLPAVRALLAQLVALVPTAALAVALDTFGRGPTLLEAAALQGAMAMLITWRIGLAPWWRIIQLLFPVALLAALGLQLPPVLFLVVFVVLLGWYWSTFRTQVPYFPSNPAVWRAVESLLPARPGVRVIDVGSGLGGFTLHLARARPDADCTGIELAPVPWLYSNWRARFTKSRARFIRGDYEKIHFGDYDVVFAYLSPAVMSGLFDKARREMKVGSLLVSYEFTIPGFKPDKTIHTTEGAPLLFVWVF